MYQGISKEESPYHSSLSENHSSLAKKKMTEDKVFTLQNMYRRHKLENALLLKSVIPRLKSVLTYF